MIHHPLHVEPASQPAKQHSLAQRIRTALCCDSCSLAGWKWGIWKEQILCYNRRMPFLRSVFWVIVSMLLIPSPVYGDAAPHEQEFIITAYYSPLPGQCCYVTGGLAADRVVNGQGVRAVDGTAVYPGMAAAPMSYPFGTRIRVPGVGVVEVHDRGGAIRELPGGRHRMDIWVGSGEEGLARALAFGVQRLRGTVYPVGSPQPPVSLALEQLPAPWERLRTYVRPEGLLGARPRSGERGYSIALLQHYLRELGYLTQPVTGLFGPMTEEAMRSFLHAMALPLPSSELTERGAAFLLAATKRKSNARNVIHTVHRGSSPLAIRTAQKVLRLLGFYRGRTHGKYDDALFRAILVFQQSKKLVGTESDPGAGRIGPLTKAALERARFRLLVAEDAAHILLRHNIQELMRKRGEHIDQFLAEGNTGPDVRTLQVLLAEHGFFPQEKINGVFGPITRAAVLSFQIAKGLVESGSDPAAGYVGPGTLRRLQEEKVRELYARVRAEGWGSALTRL